MALTTFTSGQVLTAAQLNAVQANDYNQTVSTKTASYTLVAADKGTRVVMNAAGATTITVNTSLFSAGDTLVIQNIGAGVTTVTAGTATVSSAGPLAIPQYGSGTLYFTSAGVSIFFPSAGPAATASALTLLVNQSISATSTTLSNIFSATYIHYLVKMDNVLAGSGTPFLRFRLGAGTVHCYTQLLYPIGLATQGLESSSSGTTFFDAGQLATGTNIVTVHADFMQPFLALKTGFFCYSKGYSDQSFATHGVETSATSFTDLIISNANGSTVTANIQVYGYSI